MSATWGGDRRPSPASRARVARTFAAAFCAAAIAAVLAALASTPTPDAVAAMLLLGAATGFLTWETTT